MVEFVEQVSAALQQIETEMILVGPRQVLILAELFGQAEQVSNYPV